MFASGHRKFGKVLVERLDIPISYEWSRVPDLGIWLKDPTHNKYLHRFTLHGLPNINKAIELVRERNLLKYKEEYRDEIELMVTSHNYLDLFNGPIVPSYPKSLEFKFIFDRIRGYRGYAAKDPRNLEGLFNKIFDMYPDPNKLKEKMVLEYRDLPRKVGEMTEMTIDHYEKYEKI